MAGIPIAEEFLKSKDEHLYFEDGEPAYAPHQVERFMIEFAKLHVEEALSAVIKNARLDVNGEKCLCKGFKDFEGNWITVSIDKHSISNAYPLSKIK